MQTTSSKPPLQILTETSRHQIPNGPYSAAVVSAGENRPLRYAVDIHVESIFSRSFPDHNPTHQKSPGLTHEDDLECTHEAPVQAAMAAFAPLTAVPTEGFAAAFQTIHFYHPAFYIPGLFRTPWVKAFLAHPVPHQPGTHFRYNTPATCMLSAIVQKVTGKTVLEHLTPRLFEPLGIRDPQWDTSPQGISIGGYGLFVRTEDIAKFGQLYLQKGEWQGKLKAAIATLKASR